MSDIFNNGFLEQLQATLQSVKTEAARVQEGDTPAIVIPKGMPTQVAIRHLEQRFEEESTKIEIKYTFEAWPLEGAYGLMEVLKQRFGYAAASSKNISTFFGNQEIKPELRRLEIGPDKYTDVIWGQFKIPSINGGTFNTGMVQEDGDVKFLLTGTIKQGDKQLVADVAADLREWLKTTSIYKYSALVIKTDPTGALSPDYPPEFLNVDGLTDEDLVLNEETSNIVHALIYGPLSNPNQCRDAGIKLDRGSLLYGDYGTGKTMCAKLAASKAIKNGFTFFYVEKPEDLLRTIKIARRYQPAVVFCEDIDQFLSDRNSKSNEIINELDGLTSKDTEIFLIMTTNHIDRIHPSVLRQGRMDLVLEFPRPNATSVGKLIKLYAGGDLDQNANLNEVSTIMANRIPAAIAECVRRAKLVEIANNNSSMIGDDALVIAANSLTDHLNMFDNREDKPSPSAGELIEASFAQIVANATTPHEEASKE
jgi:transitional endoplasmic reticulum ATPase